MRGAKAAFSFDVFDLLIDPLCISDSSFHIKYLNPSAKDRFDLNDDAIGRQIWDVFSVSEEMFSPESIEEILAKQGKWGGEFSTSAHSKVKWTIHPTPSNVSEDEFLLHQFQILATPSLPQSEMQSASMLLNETQRLAKLGGWEYDVASEQAIWTDELYRIFGVPKSFDPSDMEIVFSFFSKDLGKLIREAFFRAISHGEPYDVQGKFTDGHGNPLWVRSIAEPVIKNGQVVKVRGNFIDITDLKKATLALAQSKDRFQELFQNLTSGVAIYTAVDDGQDFVFKDFNKAAERLTKTPKKELLGKKVSVVFPYMEENGFIDIFRNVYKSGKPMHHPSSLYEMDRLSRWFENRVYKLPTGEIVAVFDDRTKQKQAEMSIENLNYRLGIRNQINLTFLTHTNDEAFKQVLNLLLESFDSQYGIFGYIREDGKLFCPTLSKEVWEKCQLPDKDMVFPKSAWGGLWGKALTTGKQLFSNLPLEVPAGHVPITRSVCTPILHQDDVIGVIVIGNKSDDYTEEEIDLLDSVSTVIAPILYSILEKQKEETSRKHAEAEQARLENQLLHSQKMEAVGRLAGGVAHDFNNILTGITGYSELIQSEMNREDPIYADIEEIRKASERAGILTNQLLAFSRKQAITPIVFNPNESILQSKNMLERIIGEDIEFCFSPQEDLWQLKADPGQMDQVLVNLVVNARDAMINGGKLTLETTNVSLENAVDTETQEIHSGNFVMLAVSDTGHGMSPGTREHIFEPFFTTKEKNKGTGLGLATVYGIVKQNNGFINVFSEPDIGTTIKIFFPAITSSFPPENHF